MASLNFESQGPSVGRPSYSDKETHYKLFKNLSDTLRNYEMSDERIHNFNVRFRNVDDTSFIRVEFRSCLFDNASRFSNSSFESCTFEKCYFKNITFVGCMFNSSSFKSCTFVECTFEDSPLTGCELEKVYFLDTDLNACTFNNSRFKIVELESCELDSSEFEYVEFQECVLFTNSKLNHASFKNADLTQGVFFLTELKFTDFSSARLKDCGFFVCDLEHAYFINVDMDIEVDPDSDPKTWRNVPSVFFGDDKTYSPFLSIRYFEQQPNIELGSFDRDQRIQLLQTSSNNQYMNRFLSCNMTRASFYGVDLLAQKVIFNDCNITQMTVSDIYFYENTKRYNLLGMGNDELFDETFLNSFGLVLCTAVLHEQTSNLRFANFNSVVFINADFSNLELESIDFSNADLKRANFQSARIKDCVFQNADLRGCSFQDAEIEDSDMQNADLEYSSLERTKLVNVNLENVRFLGVEGRANASFTNIQMLPSDLVSHFENRLFTRAQVSEIFVIQDNTRVNGMTYLSRPR